MTSSMVLCFLLQVSLLSCIVNARSRSKDANKKEDPHKLLKIFGRMSFVYHDFDMNMHLDLKELESMQGESMNGIFLHTKQDADNLFEAMDTNRNKKVTEKEFVSFDKWLFKFLGAGNSKSIEISQMKPYAEKGVLPNYVWLDENHDGRIDKKELRS